MQEHNELARANDSQTDPAPLQPMNFTDILDGIFTVYRNHYRLLLEIAAVYLVLKFVMDMVSIYFVTETTPGMVIAVSRFNIIAANIIATSVISVLVTAGLIYASAQVYLEREITAGAAFQQAFRRFWSYIGSGILLSLVVGVLFVTIIGIPFGIYFAIRWSLYDLPVLFEETSARSALRRSTELVKSTWWRVCGIILAIFLISFMIGFILGVSFELLLSLMGVAESEEPSDLLERLPRLFIPALSGIGWFSYTIRCLVNSGVAALTMPIALIGSTLLYFDLRIRKEAFDIEMQVTD